MLLSFPDKVKAAVDLFDDEGDLFKDKSGVVPAPVSAPKEAESHKETVVEKKVTG